MLLAIITELPTNISVFSGRSVNIGVRFGDLWARFVSVTC